MLNWDFEPATHYGGNIGQGYRSEGRGTMPSADLMVREAIQNSVDAADRVGGSPHIVFSEVLHQGKPKDDLLNALRIDSAFTSRASQAERQSEQADVESCELWKSLLSEDHVLKIVCVEDFGGPGLRGLHHDLPDTKSWWRSYVNYHGETDKGLGTNVSGGSHGKGKMALVSCSSLYLVLVYTEVEANESPSSPDSAAFSGILYLPKHSHDGSVFVGRVFFGQQYDAQTLPLTGDEARRLAELVGFKRRKGQHGLSVAIVECRAAMEELAVAIERNWWPRIVGPSGLELQVVDHTGFEYPIDFRTQEWIRDYIDAFLALSAEQPSSTDTIRTQRLNRFQNRALGSVAVALLAEPGDPGDDAPPTNRLALIRGLGMVVKYGDPIPGLPFRGVFVSDPGIDDILKRAEPLAHDGWAPETTGLSEEETEIVKKVLLRSAKAAMRLAAEEEEDRPATTRGRLIDEVFSIFAQRDRSGPPPPPSAPPTPWHIGFHGQATVREERGMQVRTDRCYVGLREDMPPGRVRISPEFRFQADVTGRRELDRLVVPNIASAQVEHPGCAAVAISAEADGSMILDLQPGSLVDFVVETRFHDSLSAHELGVCVDEVLP